MKSLRELLDLDEEECAFLDKFDRLPDDMIPFFEKFLYGTEAEAVEAEAEIRAIAEIRRRAYEK